MPRKTIFPFVLICSLFLGALQGFAQPSSVDTLSTVDPTCVDPNGGQISIEVAGGLQPYFVTVIGFLDSGGNIGISFAGAPGQTVFAFPDLALGHPSFSAGSYNFVVADATANTTSLLNIRLDREDPIIAVVAPQPFAYCSVDGPIDLLSVITVDQPGGTFTFSNAPPGSLNGSIFDPLGLSGIVTIDIEYQLGVCNTVFETFVFDISSGSLPNAGSDQVICSNDVVNLNGSIVDSTSPIMWTSSGSGTFDDDTNLSTIYRPSAADIAAGSVMLTVSTNDPDGPGPCGLESDDMLVTINPEATVMVSTDQTICTGESVSVSGSFGGSATSAFWSTSGSGNFDDNNSLTPIYTPSAADIVAGSVILIFTTNDPDSTGPCPPVSDILTVTIDPFATANAGSDQTICEGDVVNLAGGIGGAAASASWSTSGSGTFDDNTNVNAVYTPSPADIISGTLTLTLTTDDPLGPCPAASHDIIITINPAALVDASSDKTVCAGETANITGTVGGSATTASWSTSGSGIFDDNTALTTIYAPSAADIAAGTVTLSLTTNDPDGTGPCPSVSDDLILTINPSAVVSAGADQTICAGDLANLSGSFGGSATSVTWSSEGTGSFDDVNSLSPIYTPSVADLLLGTVNLSLISDDPSGPCPATSDSVVISINQPATANAGPDQDACAGDQVILSGVIGGSASNVLWTTSGSGTFENADSVNALYTPSQADIDAGTINLTMTAIDPDGNGPCPQVEDSLSLSFLANPTADAGADATVCQGTGVRLNASGGVGYSWLPTEGLSNPNIAGPLAIPNQTTTYTVTVTDANGCTSSDDVTVNVIITEPPGFDPPIDLREICIDDTRPFTITGIGMNIKWYNDPALTNLIRTGPSFTPTQAELDLDVPGTTTFYLTQDIGCGEGPADSVTINILPETDPKCNEPCPEVTYDFTSSDLFCPGDSTGAFTVSNIFSVQHPLVAYLEIFLNDVSLGRVDTVARSLTIDTLVAGEYTLSVRQIGGCFNSLEQTFTISDPFNSVAGMVEDLNEAVDEEPTGSFKVVIDPNDGMAPYVVSIELIEARFPPQTLFIDFTDAPLNNGSGKHEIQFDNLVAGTYRIAIRDGNGCEISFEQVVGSDGTIFIPNIFTPNGDQSNQTFFIRNLPSSGTTLIITNRWGKLVYEVNDYQNDWDGEDHPDGTYYYRLVTEDDSYKGWVEIWRGKTP